MSGRRSPTQCEQLLLTPTTNRITAYERVCASTSILVWKWGAMKHAGARGWRKRMHNWPTKTTGFCKSGAKSGRHDSGWCPLPFPRSAGSSSSPEVLLKSFQQSYLEPDDVIEHLRGFRHLPVYPQKTSWEVLNCPLRKLWVWCCEKVK